MARVLGLIFDYGGSWDNIEMMGLSRRSVEYHRNEQLRQRIQRELQKEKEKELRLSKTALPKIDLPKDEHIKFLDTYQSVLDEGDTMHHCIASYANKAINGNCYLFRVDYNGQMASVGERVSKGAII